MARELGTNKYKTRTPLPRSSLGVRSHLLLYTIEQTKRIVGFRLIIVMLKYLLLRQFTLFHSGNYFRPNVSLYLDSGIGSWSGVEGRRWGSEVGVEGREFKMEVGGGSRRWRFEGSEVRFGGESQRRVGGGVGDGG